MASLTHMGVRATDHVVLYGLRDIAGGCAQAGYEFFPANVGGLGSRRTPRLTRRFGFVADGFSSSPTSTGTTSIPKGRARPARATSWSCGSRI